MKLQFAQFRNKFNKQYIFHAICAPQCSAAQLDPPAVSSFVVIAYKFRYSAIFLILRRYSSRYIYNKTTLNKLFGQAAIVCITIVARENILCQFISGGLTNRVRSESIKWSDNVNKTSRDSRRIRKGIPDIAMQFMNLMHNSVQEHSRGFDVRTAFPRWISFVPPEFAVSCRIILLHGGGSERIIILHCSVFGFCNWLS